MTEGKPLDVSELGSVNIELVKQMLAKREIEEVIYRYCRGTDRCDEEILRSVYHEDAVDDHGDLFRGPASDFIPFVVELLQDRFITTMHTVGNINIELDDDRADVETYCMASHITRDVVPSFRLFGCRYIDKFERRPATGWRILHRTVVAEWQIAQDKVAPLPSGMVPGTRGRTDISYF